MSAQRFTRYALFLSCALSLTAISAPVFACGNAIHHAHMKTRAKANGEAWTLLDLERHVEQDLYREAISIARKMDKTLDFETHTWRESEDPEAARRTWLVAISVVRTLGNYPLAYPGRGIGVSNKQARERVAWATEVLAEHHKANADNPRYIAYYGNALAQSRDEQLREQARELLYPLAKDDLVPDAFTWLAIGKLRRWGGDREGWDEARARCKELSNEPRACVWRYGRGELWWYAARGRSEK